MSTTSIKQIRTQAHSEVGTLLESSADVILEQWCSRALAEQPHARRVHGAVLRDHLGKLLRAIGRALREPVDGESHRPSALEHGEQRWESGWSLAELVKDYQLLRLVVVEYLERLLARPLRSSEVVAIGVFFDDAISLSVTRYTAHKDDEALRNERQRVQLLEEANRRKDEFLAVLAHELRNPLTPIITSTRVLRMLLGTTQEAVRQSIDIVERQAGQLSRLVDDMLDLARMGQGRFELRKVRLNLEDILKQSAAAAESQITAHGHQLIVAIPQTPVELDADPDRLLQVIANLLNNAAKYTNTGGTISLAGECRENHAVIRVCDTGIGIPSHMLPHVFDLFTQVGGSEPRKEGGLGIGLTLVRRLVEQHGGTVTCRSDGEGHGSEFIVRVPLAGAQIPASADDPIVEPGIRIVPHDSRKF